MQERANALFFLDPACRNLLSDGLRDTISRVDFALQGRGNHLKVRALSVGDWGFAAIEGRCRGITRYDDQSFRRLKYAALTLSLCDEDVSTRLPARHMLFTRRPLQETIFPEHDFSYLSLYIPDDYLGALAGRKIPDDCLIDARSGAGSVVRATLLSLMQQAMGKCQGSALAALLPGFLHMALSLVGVAPAETAGTETRFARITRYLEENHSNPELDAAALARACCMSERQLYREFDRNGSSFAAELRRLRLQRAKSMLAEEPGKSLSEIAAASGFSCPAVFSRTFRQAFATTPRDFRAENAQPLRRSQRLSELTGCDPA
ncbi:MAG: helix-turn-helix domain-containing protein [Porticoccaceae bacterium]